MSAEVSQRNTAGWFLVIEGPDGSGKTTLVERLASRLRDRGVDLVQVRQPGGTPAAELARRGAFDPEIAASPVAELFFILAARADLVTKIIRPALDEGRCVLCDRHDLSTEAYQVLGRGLPRDAVLAANRLATGGLAPDLTVVLDVPVDVGRERQRVQGKTLDRMERESAELHQRVRAFYRQLSGPDIAHVDAVGSASDVEAAAWRVIEERLGNVGADPRVQVRAVESEDD